MAQGGGNCLLARQRRGVAGQWVGEHAGEAAHQFWGGTLYMRKGGQGQWQPGAHGQLRRRWLGGEHRRSVGEEQRERQRVRWGLASGE
jgi:hypothetical protein